MIMFVEQLEQHLLYRDEKDIPTDYDEAGEPIDFCEQRVWSQSLFVKYLKS